MKKELSFKSMLMGTAMVAAASVMALSSAQAAGGAAAADPNAVPGSQKAVTLMGMWVGAGAPNGEFEYTDLTGHKVKGTFDKNILPLFTQEGIWGVDADGTALPACSSCHTGITEESLHEMDLTSYKGLMTGGDSLANPPGVGLLGETKPGDKDFNWGLSKMKQRLRDNRMPPGIEFDITETNRDGPCFDDKNNLTGELSDCKRPLTKIWEEWAAAGGKNDDVFKKVLLPSMTTEGYFGKDADGTPLPACSSCHTGITEESLHEMDLTSYDGLMTGGDSLAKPPGVSLLAGYSHRTAKKGEMVKDMPMDWGHSTMRHRIRDNRMPPGIEFDITEENRDGPVVLGAKRLD